MTIACAGGSPSTKPKQQVCSTEVRKACWDALSNTPGTLAIRKFDTPLADTFRADVHGFVVSESAVKNGVYFFDIDHKYPPSG